MSDKREPGAFYWEKLEPIADSISIYDGPELFLRQFSTVHPSLGNLLAAHWCQSEIKNGGFLQFFSNSTGVLAPEAVRGLRALGLEECESVVEKAMAYFGDPYPRKREKRLELLTSTSPVNGSKKSAFDYLDDEFFTLLPWQDDRFEKAADDYARRHFG